MGGLCKLIVLAPMKHYLAGSSFPPVVIIQIPPKKMTKLRLYHEVNQQIQANFEENISNVKPKLSIKKNQTTTVPTKVTPTDVFYLEFTFTLDVLNPHPFRNESDIRRHQGAPFQIIRQHSNQSLSLHRFKHIWNLHKWCEYL